MRLWTKLLAALAIVGGAGALVAQDLVPDVAAPKAPVAENAPPAASAPDRAGLR